MIRTQIQLAPSQERLVRRFAEREGISMAEAIRRCIDKALSNREWDDIAAKYRAAAVLAGSFKSLDGATDLSLNHDVYLDEAFE